MKYSVEAQSGTILITALLYLLVVTLSVMGTFSSGILQTKMMAHFQQEMQAFGYAESALLAGENTLKIGEEEGEGSINANAVYKFTKIATPQNACGLFYQMDAIGTDIAAKVHLQSIFTFPKAQPKPCKGSVSDPHRVLWRQINE